MNKRTLAIVVSAIVQAVTTAGLFGGSLATARVSEESLGTVPTGISVAATVTSRDGLHVAYVVHKGGKQLVIVDGRPGAKYDEISHDTLVFSPDGKRIAYLAKKDDKQLVVVDVQPGPGYDRTFDPVFSPDSRRVAYVAENGGRAFVVTDGQPGPEHSGILEGTLVFSPDSRRVAYVAQKDGKCLVVIDGQPGPEYDDICFGCPVWLARAADTADGPPAGLPAAAGTRHHRKPAIREPALEREAARERIRPDVCDLRERRAGRGHGVA